MKNEIVTACYQLVTALINGTCQGLLLAVLVAGGLRLMGRINAATRHAVWFGTLLLVAALIPAHWLRERLDSAYGVTLAERGDSILQSASPDAIPADMVDAHPTAIMQFGRRGSPHPSPMSSQLRHQMDAPNWETTARNVVPEERERFSTALEESSIGKPSVQRQTVPPLLGERVGVRGTATSVNPLISMGWGEMYTAAPDDASGHTQNISGEQPARPSLLAALDAAVVNQAQANDRFAFLGSLKEKAKSVAERLANPVPWNVAAEIPIPLAVGIPLVWLAIAVAKFSLLLGQMLRIRRLKRDSAIPSPELNAVFNSLRQKLDVRREVALKVSHEHKSPVVLGFLRPAILLPASAGLDEADHVLRHELAHVRRRDDWANLVQQFVKAAFFFHPAICWVSKRISLEREIACDDQVLQSTRQPRAYALLLADLAGRLQPSLLAPGVSNNQSQLKQRIDMILNPNRNTSSGLAKARLGMLASMAAAVAMAAFYSAPRVVFAQGAPPPPAAPPVAEDVVPVPDAVVPIAGGAVVAINPVAPTPPVPPVAAGPKFKPGAAITVSPPMFAPQGPVVAHGAPTPAPLPPLAAITPSPAPAPHVFALAGSDSQPQPGTLGQPPRPAYRGRDSSLEERLARLEKLVESLLAQPKGKPGLFEFYMKPPGEKGLTLNRDSDWEKARTEVEMEKRKQAEFDKRRAEVQKQIAEIEKQRSALGPKEKAKIKELAEQQAKLATEQAKMARDAEQVAREAQRAAKDQPRRRVYGLYSSRDGARHELEALHRQHDALQKQMEKLERQIEKLESEQESFEDEQDNTNERQDDSSADEQAQRSSNSNSNANSDSNKACTGNAPSLKQTGLIVATELALPEKR